MATKNPLHLMRCLVRDFPVVSEKEHVNEEQIACEV